MTCFLSHPILVMVAFLRSIAIQNFKSRNLFLACSVLDFMNQISFWLWMELSGWTPDPYDNEVCSPFYLQHFAKVERRPNHLVLLHLASGWKAFFFFGAETWDERFLFNVQRWTHSWFAGYHVKYDLASPIFFAVSWCIYVASFTLTDMW